MREILFRGKRKDNGEWIYGYVNQHRGEPILDCMCEQINSDDFYIYDYAAKIDTGIYGLLYNIIPETVGQFTGLTDKNGVRIFEGDIIKNNWCFIYSPSVIRFGEYFQPFNDDIHTKHIGFFVEHSGDYMNTSRHDLGFFANKCEVIGNIHENPELLEGGEGE